METKMEIRKRIIEQRNALGMEAVNEKSAAVFRRLCALRQYEEAGIVLVYMDYRNEVRTGEFIKKCKQDGKRVILPKVEVIGDKLMSLADGRVSPSDKVLSLYEINRVETDTVPGYKGIPEPDSRILRKAAPEEIDLAVVPGVAFDCERRRIGYGAGYYDRLLPQLRYDSVKAGVAYSLQVMDRIPAGKHDIPMDLVVTENRLILKG